MSRATEAGETGGPAGAGAGGGLMARANLALALKLAAAGVSYLFLLLLARSMTLQGFGTVALFLNMSLFLAVIGAAGQQMALLRHVPPLVRAGAGAALRGLLRQAAGRAAAVTLGLTLGLALWATGPLAPAGLAAMRPAEILLGLALVPLTGWVEFQAHLARALHRLVLALVPREMLWRGLVGLAVLLAAAGGGAPVPATAVLALLAAGLVLVGLGQGWRLFRRPGLPRGAAAAQVPRPAGGAFWISSVSNMFLAHAGVIAAGLLAGPAVAGLFFAANRLALLMGFISTSTHIALAPMLSEAWHRGERARAAALLRRATLRNALGGAVLAALIAALAPWLLQLFGREYAAAVTTLRLLVLAELINACGGPGDIALNMCGQARAAMRAALASLAGGVLLVAGGMVLGGAEGAAVGIVLATLLRKGLFWAACRARLGLRCDLLAALSPPPASPSPAEARPA